jgi:hypothetical protein
MRQHPPHSGNFWWKWLRESRYPKEYPTHLDTTEDTTDRDYALAVFKEPRLFSFKGVFGARDALYFRQRLALVGCYKELSVMGICVECEIRDRLHTYAEGAIKC